MGWREKSGIWVSFGKETLEGRGKLLSGETKQGSCYWNYRFVGSGARKSVDFLGLVDVFVTSEYIYIYIYIIIVCCCTPIGDVCYPFTRCLNCV